MSRLAHAPSGWTAPSRWSVLVAVALAAGIAASPVLADHGKRGERRPEVEVKEKHRRSDHVTKRRYRDHRAPRVVQHHVVYRRVPYGAYPRWSRRHSQVIYYNRSPYYYHAGFGFYFGGAAARFDIVDVPPPGFVYYDPYCDVTFVSAHLYRRHLHWHHHPAVIRVVEIRRDGYYCDPGDYDDYDGDYYDD